jgi:hypothetical protein
MKKIPSMLRLAGSLLITALAISSAGAQTKPKPPPNFLIIIADDCTYNDLPLYGGKNAKIPNIDALAARGLTFNQAYLASAMCQPCRAELYLRTEDSYELTNLAADPGYAEQRDKLSAALDAWMASQSDPGAAVDTVEALKASRQGEHLHGPATAK